MKCFTLRASVPLSLHPRNSLFADVIPDTQNGGADALATQVRAVDFAGEEKTKDGWWVRFCTFTDKLRDRFFSGTAASVKPLILQSINGFVFAKSHLRSAASKCLRHLLGAATASYQILIS